MPNNSQINYALRSEAQQIQNAVDRLDANDKRTMLSQGLANILEPAADRVAKLLNKDYPCDGNLRSLMQKRLDGIVNYVVFFTRLNEWAQDRFGEIPATDDVCGFVIATLRKLANSPFSLLDALLSAFDWFYKTLDATTVPVDGGGRTVGGIEHAVALSEATNALYRELVATNRRLDRQHGHTVADYPVGLVLTESDSPDGPFAPIPADKIRIRTMGIGGNGADAMLLAAMQSASKVAGFPIDKWNEMQAARPSANHQRFHAGEVVSAHDLAVLESAAKLFRMKAPSASSTFSPELVAKEEAAPGGSTDWMVRPFDPDCMETTPPAQAVIDAIRTVIPGWDGVNWEAVREILRRDGFSPEELREMDLFRIQMIFATGQKAIIIKLGGKPETNTPTIISEAPNTPKNLTSVNSNDTGLAIPEVIASNQGEDDGTLANWRDVQLSLLEIYDRNEPWPGYGDLEKPDRLNCSRSTISKAIHCPETALKGLSEPERDKVLSASRKLKGWLERGQNKSPRVTGLNGVVADNTPDTREADPANTLTNDQIDAAMAEVMDKADSVKRAELNNLNRDGQRRLAEAYLDQKNYVEPSPLMDDPLGKKPLQVIEHKRL